MQTLTSPASSTKSQGELPASRGRKRISPLVFISFFTTLVLGFGAGAFFVAQRGASSQAAGPVNATSVVPAYWGSDQNKWSQLELTHPAGTVAIANFNAGPPATGDSAFAQAVAKAHSYGLKVIGYVPTGHGGRAVSTVHRDVDGWYAYQVDGIFLDEGTASQGNLSFYQGLANYIRSKPGTDLVVFNAGWIPQTSGYLNIADITVIFEDNAGNFSNFSVPAWITDSSRFAAIVENVSSSQLSNIMQLSEQRHIGYVYTIPDSQNYGQLPSYWSNEASMLRGVVSPGTGMQIIQQPKSVASPTATPPPSSGSSKTPPPCSVQINGKTLSGCSGKITINGQTCSFSITRTGNTSAVDLQCPQNKGKPDIN